jgi:hypothetical protein
VREDLILVDAKEGREIILRKIADWKMDKPQQMPWRSKSVKPGKRDLRELAKALGLGKDKSAAKTAAKQGPKSSRNKS